MVDFVLLGSKVRLRLLDRLFQSLLVLAQLGDVLVLLGEFTVESLDLVVFGLLLLLRLQPPATATQLPRTKPFRQSAINALLELPQCTRLQVYNHEYYTAI